MKMGGFDFSSMDFLANCIDYWILVRFCLMYIYFIWLDLKNDNFGSAWTTQFQIIICLFHTISGPSSFPEK